MILHVGQGHAPSQPSKTIVFDRELEALGGLLQSCGGINTFFTHKLTTLCTTFLSYSFVLIRSRFKVTGVFRKKSVKPVTSR